MDKQIQAEVTLEIPLFKERDRDGYQSRERGWAAESYSAVSGY